jgi:hypothetical protein
MAQAVGVVHRSGSAMPNMGRTCDDGCFGRRFDMDESLSQPVGLATRQAGQGSAWDSVPSRYSEPLVQDTRYGQRPFGKGVLTYPSFGVGSRTRPEGQGYALCPVTCHDYGPSDKDAGRVSNTVPGASSCEGDEHLQPIFDDLPADLTPAERREAIEFVQEYKNIFSRDEQDLGRTTLVTHRIETGDARPIRQGLRRHPQVYLDVIDTEIEKLVSCGVVEPASSPWASNVVVVTKHDSSPRITLDFRQLNNVTYKDRYPLPIISECLDSFKGASYFGILDLRSSFYQVPLDIRDRDKTAFVTRKGQWRFRRLPMGLTNSPATFQRLMDLVLRGLTWSSVLVYVDDVLVFARSFAELKQRLREVFERLRAANLKLKPSKVRLFQREIKFLGHIVSAAGVAMDKSKVDEVTSWRIPRNVRDVRRFLGLVGYFRKYIKGYAAHAAPLHELTKKGEPFSWNQRRNDAFQHLKECLLTGPILAISVDDGQYILDVDASDIAAGAVLQQVQGGVVRVISYGSRAFNDCEKRYCVTRKELAALIFGLKHYRQYLLGRQFIIRTDHAALTYLRTAKELVGQQARWLDLLSEYDFQLQHRAGASHGNADAMSRKLPCERQAHPCRSCRNRMLNARDCDPDEATVTKQSPNPTIRTLISAVITRRQSRLPLVGTDTVSRTSDARLSQAPPNAPRPATVSDSLTQSRKGRRRRRRIEDVQERTDVWSEEYLSECQKEDRDIAQLRVWLLGGARPVWAEVRGESQALKAYWQQWNSFRLEHGLVTRFLERINREQEETQLVLPRQLRKKFLELVHCGAAGHLGIFKTREHVKMRAYWFKWRDDVDRYCRSCGKCSEYYRGRAAPRQGRLHPARVGSPTEVWGADLSGPFPKSTRGHVYILSVVCLFTKYLILVPLRDKSAITVAKAIWEEVFLKYGGGDLWTDNGTEFRNSLLSELSRMMGVHRSFTTSYEARTNGACERSHGTINSMLAKCVEASQRNWDDCLGSVAFSYNASVHESTMHTPFFLLHGFQPRWTPDFLLGRGGRPQYSTNDYADMLVDRLEKAHSLTREHLRTTAERMSCWYDKRVNEQIFVPGERVRVLNLRLYPRKTPKWSRRYAEIATVMKRINDVTYVIMNERWRVKERVVHVDKLKKVIPEYTDAVPDMHGRDHGLALAQDAGLEPGMVGMVDHDDY